MKLYPLLMAPYFRSGSATPWGGSMLRDAFLKDAPEQTGESLEVSTLPGCESSVRNGDHAGVTLPRMIELWGAELTGAADACPPQLKLIDAREPVDRDASSAEAWVVLNCQPGAKLIAGEERAVRPGDVLSIPAGQPRSIGADIQLYALQAPGEPGDSAAKLRGVTSLCRGGSRTYYISNSSFELCRLNVSGEMPVSDGRMLLLTPLGPCKLRWGEEELALMPFDSAIVPAALEGAAIVSDDCKVLMASLPNREALRRELGYRAEGVAGLTE